VTGRTIPRRNHSPTVVCHLKKIMRYLILIIILNLTLSCKSQKSTVINEPITELKPPFNTQGEQEDYWAQA